MPPKTVKNVLAEPTDYKTRLLAAAKELKTKLEEFTELWIIYHNGQNEAARETTDAGPVNKEQLKVSKEGGGGCGESVSNSTSLLEEDECDDEFDQEVKAILTFQLCKATKAVVPNCQRKIDEILIAGENWSESVQVHEHGADIVEGGYSFEVKTSICLKKNRQKCNFSWPLGKPDQNDRERGLLGSIRSKTGGNSVENLNAILNYDLKWDEEVPSTGYTKPSLYKRGGGFFARLTDRNGIVLKTYFITGFFMHHYFKRLLKYKTPGQTHNLGCSRCESCKSWHRLQNLEQYDSVLAQRLREFFKGKGEGEKDRVPMMMKFKDEKEEGDLVDSALDWEKVFDVVESNCEAQTKKSSK